MSGRYYRSNYFPSPRLADDADIRSMELIDRFFIMKTLTDDWDLYNADPVPPERIGYAEETILTLMRQGYPEPTIGATPCGDIDIVWNELGVYCVLAEPEFGLKITIIVPQSLYEVNTHPYKSSPSVHKFFARLLAKALDQSKLNASRI